MMKASGTRVVLMLSLVMSWLGGAARADDDKDVSGKLTSWTVTGDGDEVIGSESLRAVTNDGGMFFASGELKLKKGKKAHRKTHMQRDAQGKLLKYQRVEAGLKGAGFRLFEWQGQMRLAAINGSGKPVDVGVLASARVFDEGLWHLYQTWDLPGRCEGARRTFFDLGKRASGEAALECAGTRKVYDDKGAAIEVNRFTVGGAGGEVVELWVDKHGGLVGGKAESRTMLRTKYTLAPGKGSERDAGEDEPEPEPGESIKERGVGE